MTEKAEAGAGVPMAGGTRRVADWGFTAQLLTAGMIAGPLYLVLGLAQAFARDGFDFSRHALSHLANGPGGWVQTVNFLLTGLLVIGAATGIARALRPLGRVGSLMLGLYGVSMIAAAVFPADPVDGFPPGTPEGMPTAVSTTGVLHFAAGGIGFLALAVSCLVLARAFSRRGDRTLARLSLSSGLVVLAGFFGPMVLQMPSLGIAGIWLAVVVGWGWLAVLSASLRARLSV